MGLGTAGGTARLPVAVGAVLTEVQVVAVVAVGETVRLRADAETGGPEEVVTFSLIWWLPTLT